MQTLPFAPSYNFRFDFIDLWYELRIVYYLGSLYLLSGHNIFSFIVYAIDYYVNGIL